ncbi:hypothetical protein ONZ45_g14920 [Pleurotus djamor]|nr:hypothetical protein ONZ45_g14920 [Pleurotus djamor]
MALVSRLVMLQARDGMLKQSLDWIVRDDDKPKPKPPLPKQANVYAGLLQHIKANDTKNAAAVDTVLAHMKQNNVPVNTNVFNALIGIQLRRGNVSQAFSLYDVLVKLSRTQPIRPDASTFASLFSAIQLLRTSRLRTARNRRLKDADNILHPRFLFRDLIYCDATTPLDKRHAPPTPIITPSLLNLALRTFLSLKDTAAAYVVVRSFNVLRLHPDLATYYIVLKLLIDRLRYDLWRARRSGEQRWGDYMLGISWREVPSIKVDDALAVKVLAIGGPHTNMPTLQQIDGDQSLPEGMALDTLPLERILKRAVHAEVSVAVNSPATSRLVSEALRKAKQDMLPPKQALVHKS